MQLAVTAVGPEPPTPASDGKARTHLMLEESVLQGLVSRVAPCTLEEQLVFLAQGSSGKHEHEGTVGCGLAGADMPTPSCRQGTHRVVVSHVLDLFVVISPRQLGQALWVKPPAVRKELGTVLLGQLCAKGVDGDDEGAAVCFKLWGQCTCKERGCKEGSSQSVGRASPRDQKAGGWAGTHL